MNIRWTSNLNLSLTLVDVKLVFPYYSSCPPDIRRCLLRCSTITARVSCTTPTACAGPCLRQCFTNYLNYSYQIVDSWDWMFVIRCSYVEFSPSKQDIWYSSISQKLWTICDNTGLRRSWSTGALTATWWHHLMISSLLREYSRLNLAAGWPTLDTETLRDFRKARETKFYPSS